MFVAWARSAVLELVVAGLAWVCRPDVFGCAAFDDEVWWWARLARVLNEKEALWVFEFWLAGPLAEPELIMEAFVASWRNPEFDCCPGTSRPWLSIKVLEVTSLDEMGCWFESVVGFCLLC